MEDKTLEDIASTSEATEKVAEETTETQQDPLKTELEKVKGGRTELEKAQYSLKKNAERLVELGGDPGSILGIEKGNTELDKDDDTPITRAELKKMISAGATRSALQLTEDIEDQSERELVQHYLQHRIAPSGNSQDDFRDARRIANSVKNEQIVQELARKSIAKSHSNGSSGNAKDIKVEAELSKEELMFTKPPFNMSREQILKARPQ